jgi:hypothetical protein
VIKDRDETQVKQRRGAERISGANTELATVT